MCEILSGYSKICDVAGGVETLYAFAMKNSSGVSNIATYTVANGAVSALTLVAGKYAYAFNVEMETANFSDAAVGERSAGAYGRSQSAAVVLHGNTAEMIVQIELLATGRHALIAKMNDGTFELLFATNGAKVLDDRTSGTAFEDLNGNTLTWTGKEKAKAPKISSAIVLALLAPTS